MQLIKDKLGKQILANFASLKEKDNLFSIEEVLLSQSKDKSGVMTPAEFFRAEDLYD